MEDPKCSNCGKVATQRCSKCKNQWYCSRECQLKQWKAHKALCEIISNNRREEDVKNEEYKKIQTHKEAAKKGPLIQEIRKDD